MIFNIPLNDRAGTHLKFYKLAALILMPFIVSACNSEAHQSELPDYSVAYDPNRDPFVDGQAAVALAKSSNRRILIEVGGDWCGWCRALAELAKSDTEIKRQLHKNFVLLKVNYSDENKNEAFLSALPESQGYPHMYISDKNGTVLHSQDTADFLVNGQYSRERFGEFLEQWKNS